MTIQIAKMYLSIKYWKHIIYNNMLFEPPSASTTDNNNTINNKLGIYYSIQYFNIQP